MPFKVKTVWIICCLFVFISFSYFSMQRSIHERRVESKKRMSEKIEEAKRKRQIRKFKEKAFHEATKELKELVALGQYGLAINRAKEILHKDNENGSAYTWWGIALVKTNQLDLAIEKFEKASQLDQSNPRTYLYWGLTLAMGKKFEEAILKYRTVLQLDSENSNAYAYWGDALSNLEVFGESIEKLEKALDLNPYNSLALGVLVDNYYTTRQYGKAWQVVYQARKGKVALDGKALKKLREVMPDPNA